jgi:hypothetical protein
VLIKYAAINRNSANEQNRLEPLPVTIRGLGIMDDADLLRSRATRLFALAERSRQQGYSDYAEELDRLARGRQARGSKSKGASG